MLPETPAEQLHAKRKVAILAVDRLLRVCVKYESDEWLCHYKELFDALQEERDEAAIRLLQSIDSNAVPTWVASARLAEQVRKTIARLRTHIMYGDQRPPLTLDPDDPDIEAEGTNEQQLEKRLAELGIHPGFPVIGLPVSELVLALSLIESTESSVDKRILSIRVQKDGSIFVNTGEEMGSLAGGGNSFVLKKKSGQWVILQQIYWTS